MPENLKAVILVPYVASSEASDEPLAEAEFLYSNYFKNAQVRQIVGENLEGRMFIKDQIGFYIVGEGKTNASMYSTALLNEHKFDFSNTKFILFGCCGCARDVGIVGDIYLVGETVDMDLGHHADFRDSQNDGSHSWYPNESFSRFGYISLDHEFYQSSFKLIKNEKASTTENAENFMAKSFKNEQWALRDPKIFKACSVTSDSYWKGNYDHNNAKYVVDFYKCKYPFAATNMEDIAVAQVFKNYGMLENLLILRFAVNTDVFMGGQNAESIWCNGYGSFDSYGFDSFDDAFPVITKCATEICWKIISSIN